MAIDWGTELGGNSPQQSQGSVGNAAVASGSAQPGSKMAEPRHDPVKMLQYAKDAGTRNVESMGQIGADWFDGIPQVYDDDQIAAAKDAISRAQTPEEVQQIIQGLARQNKGGNVGAINSALGRLAVGWSQSPIPTVDSLLGSREKIDVGENDGAMHWLGKWAVPLVQDYLDLTGGAVPKSLNLIKPMGRSLEAIRSGLNPVNDAVHTYTDAINAVNYVKSVPGRVGAAKDKAVTGVKNWYTDSVEAGKHGMTRKQYHAERAAAPAGETAQTGGRAAETAAPAAETAAPAAERTAASETAAPAAERTAAPAPRQEPAPQQPAPAPRQEPAPQQPAPAPRQEPAPQQPAPAAERTAAPETAADGGVSELANAGNAGREAAAGGQAAGREAAAAGEAAAGREAATAGEAAADGGVSELANAGAAGRAPKTGAGEAAGGAPKTGAGEAAGSASATGSVPKRGEAFGDVSWSNDIAARDQATDFVTSGKYGLGQTAEWYRGQLISNTNLDNAAIDHEIARFIQQFTGGAK